MAVGLWSSSLSKAPLNSQPPQQTAAPNSPLSNSPRSNSQKVSPSPSTPAPRVDIPDSDKLYPRNRKAKNKKRERDASGDSDQTVTVTIPPEFGDKPEEVVKPGTLLPELDNPAGRELVKLLLDAQQLTFRKQYQAAAPIQEQAVQMAKAGFPPMISVRAMDDLASLYGTLHEHSKAVAILRKVLELRSKNPSITTPDEMVVTATSLVQELLRDFQLAEAQELLRSMLQTLQLPESAQGVLLQLESTILECKGDYISAVERFERSTKMIEEVTAGMILKHLGLLRGMLEFETVPESIQLHIEGQIGKLEDQLLQYGAWSDPQQLPANMIPGLRTQPVHQLDDYDDSAKVQKAYDALILRTDDLRKEYLRLKEQQLMIRERECIHDIDKGHWSRFEVNGAWQKLDDHGCSQDSPIACTLYHQLRRKGLRVIRAGYSAIEANTHIRPHYGVTNGQLKFHLGLIVPSSKQDEDPCAYIRIANQTHSWSEGDVLFFDDSYEHEVWNKCNSERVVFQVVFVHPDFREGDLGILGDVPEH